MSGVIEPVDWQQSADELHQRYRAERDLRSRTLRRSMSREPSWNA
jgi:hypothetical protein